LLQVEEKKQTWAGLERKPGIFADTKEIGVGSDQIAFPRTERGPSFGPGKKK
jgi:hypothetical protein